MTLEQAQSTVQSGQTVWVMAWWTKPEQPVPCQVLQVWKNRHSDGWSAAVKPLQEPTHGRHVGGERLLD